MTNAKTLRVMRLEKRLTQAEVADKMKVSQSYYSQIERGEKRQDAPEAMKVISGMRKRGSRTGGGEQKAGRRRED
ncbi:MAG TPA: helix-turn-helix transcriptional regulator [Dyella sp.]|uniref:helix-turn-helix domain-containing protein n=1 Tax=Dyella sp. TaxID=1869338 RepID=UPI002CBEA1E1|nr:helix-turn-helix transcriptional regulator [Dyella sp.]HUB88500.1 helix-turn-helix transcriptional regulator [Dyella sp.]